jgi:hypothetical protein
VHFVCAHKGGFATVRFIQPTYNLQSYAKLLGQSKFFVIFSNSLPKPCLLLTRSPAFHYRIATSFSISKSAPLLDLISCGIWNKLLRSGVGHGPAKRVRWQNRAWPLQQRICISLKPLSEFFLIQSQHFLACFHGALGPENDVELLLSRYGAGNLLFGKHKLHSDIG